MKIKCPEFKILVPIDGSEHSKRAVRFAAAYINSMRKGFKGIALVRVITGRYMYERVPYIDFRSEVMKKADSYLKFKQAHIEKNVKPSLEECEKILIEAGIKPLEKYILEGDPADEIIKIANEGDFSIIMMARRGLSEIMGIILGSVTSKVVHRTLRQTVYVIGRRRFESERSPISNILVPIDGSAYSMKGVEHCACIAQEMGELIKNITLLRVINLAFYERMIDSGVDPESEAMKIIDLAKDTFFKENVSKDIIRTKIRMGNPAEEIIKENEEGNYNLIVIGRKGRTALKDLLLGGVSSTVISRCQDTNIAVASFE
jgi:nucleotide-binding universal stress UspA family protein